MFDKNAIRKGIAAYRHEQDVIIRLLRKKGQFTERDFDRWFKGREYKKRVLLHARGITGDTVLLGIGMNGFSMWATYLDLLQHMMAIDLIDAKTENGLVTYRLPNGS